MFFPRYGLSKRLRDLYYSFHVFFFEFTTWRFIISGIFLGDGFLASGNGYLSGPWSVIGRKIGVTIPYPDIRLRALPRAFLRRKVKRTIYSFYFIWRSLLQNILEDIVEEGLGWRKSSLMRVALNRFILALVQYSRQYKNKTLIVKKKT